MANDTPSTTAHAAAANAADRALINGPDASSPRLGSTIDRMLNTVLKNPWTTSIRRTDEPSPDLRRWTHDG
jgi:hypothetical protein